jgi:hypothetical protein
MDMTIQFGNTVCFSDQSIKWDGPKHFIIHSSTGMNTSDMMVDLNLETGTITFGARYKPTLAAEAFWTSVVSEYSDYLKWKKDRTK